MIEKIEDIYYSLIPYEYRPHNLWYEFKCRFWLKYSTVKSKHLPHTWVDRSELMPYTMFQILCDFMEKEYPGDRIDWEDSSPEHAKAWKTFNHLYFWWNNIYLKWEENKYEIPSNIERGEWQEMNWDMEINMSDRLIKNMKLLSEYHQYMWT